MNSEFTEYRQRVRDLATPVLRMWNTSLDPPTLIDTPHDNVSVACAMHAAGLLIEEDPELYPGLVHGVKMLTSLAAKPPGGTTNDLQGVVDLAGHSRDIYWPFVLHIHLAAFGLRYESLPVGMWSKCEGALEQAVTPMLTIERHIDNPADQSEVAITLWMALCVCEHSMLASRDVGLELVDSVVWHIVNQPGQDGALHAQDHPGFKSLDGWIYEELVGLHALAHLAVLRRNQQWARRVEQIAKFHLDHTQPDHVTHQPWGLFAMAWPKSTRLLADQQIHDAQVYLAKVKHCTTIQDTSRCSAEMQDPLVALLLADAAAMFARFSG